MSRFFTFVLLMTFLALSPQVFADYNYYRDYHPYHHHHAHYHGGYIYCSICHLYHHYDHPHFHHGYHPYVVEHGTSVKHQTVTETVEVVE